MFKSLKIGLVFYQNNQYKTQKNTICYLTNKWLFQKKKIGDQFAYQLTQNLLAIFYTTNVWIYYFMLTIVIYLHNF